MDVENGTNNSLTSHTVNQVRDYLSNIIISFLWALIFVIIVILNTSALLVFYRTRRTHSSTKVFLMSLVVGDLASGFLFAAPTSVLAFYYPSSGVFCRIQAYAGHVLYYGTILSLFGVNIERFIAIVYPLHYPQLVTTKRARWTVCVIWLVVACYAILDGHLSDWKALPFFLRCFSAGVKDNPILTWTFIVIFGPLLYVTTIIMYIKVYTISRSHTKRLESFQRRPVSESSKTAQTVLILLSLYGISWIPTCGVGAYLYISGGTVPDYVSHLNFMIQTSNSWFDPLIYAVRNAQFRKELRKALKC